MAQATLGSSLWTLGCCFSSLLLLKKLSILHADALGRGEFLWELVASVLPLLEQRLSHFLGFWGCRADADGLRSR